MFLVNQGGTTGSPLVPIRARGFFLKIMYSIDLKKEDGTCDEDELTLSYQ
jgi:hypothetical protein